HLYTRVPSVRCLPLELDRRLRPALVCPHILVLFTFRPPPRSSLFPYTTLFRSVSRTDSDKPFSKLSSSSSRRTSSEFEQTVTPRSEEHTSELQSPDHLVCRLLLEKKNSNDKRIYSSNPTRITYDSRHKPA